MLTSEQVKGKEFTTVRFRRGYDMRDVDEYLDRVIYNQLHDIESGRLRLESTATLPVPTGFAIRLFAESYDKDEVEAFVAEIIETFRGYREA